MDIKWKEGASKIYIRLNFAWYEKNPTVRFQNLQMISGKSFGLLGTKNIVEKIMNKYQ